MPVPISSSTPVTGYYIADEPLFAGTEEQLLNSLSALDVPDPTAAGGYVTRSVPQRQLLQLLTNYRAIPLATAQALAADGEGIQPIFYRILRGSGGSPAGRRGDVVVQGIAVSPGTVSGEGDIPARFASVGLWLNPDTGEWVQAFYDVATDTVTPTQLTAQQVADVQALVSPVFARTPAGFLGFADVNAAFASGELNFELNQYTNSFTGTATLGDASLAGNGGVISVGNGGALTLTDSLVVEDAVISANGGNLVGTADLAAFLRGRSTVEYLVLNGGQLSAFDRSTVEHLSGTGTVYLYDDASAPTVGPGITVVDRRPGAAINTLNIYGLSPAEETRVKALFTSPTQPSAYDATYTPANAPFGAVVFDFANGDKYELGPNKADLDGAGMAKPYWIRL